MPPTNFIGIDIGNTSTRLAFVSSTTVEQGVEVTPPQIQVFGTHTQPYLYSLVRSDGPNPQSVDADGILSLDPGTPGSALKGMPLLALEQRDSSAQLLLQGLGKAALVRLKNTFRAADITSSAFQVVAGVPASWDPTHAETDMLLQGLREAGLGQAAAWPDACAAVLNLLYQGDLNLVEGPQSWLVVDVGGSGTRASVITKNENSTSFQVSRSSMFKWGANQLDAELYQEWWQPTYWKQAEQPTPIQRQAILLLLREMKEQLAQSNQPAYADFRVLGIEEQVELSPQTAVQIFSQAYRKLADVFQSIKITGLLDGSIERVFLIGGGACLPQVFATAQRYFGPEKTICPKNPAQVVVFGLALARSGYVPSLNQQQNKPEVIVNGSFVDTAYQAVGAAANTPPTDAPNTTHPAGQPGAPVLPPGQAEKARGEKARKLIYQVAIAGVIVALVMILLPFGAWPFLMMMEIYMMGKIANLYGYRYTDGLIVMAVVGLLILSIGLSTVLAPLTETIMCFIKPVIAGVVIWGMGEGFIAILEWDIKKQS